jgi:uncharacterized membrane protein YkoI
VGELGAFLIALLISSVAISCGMFGNKETDVTITQVPAPVRAAIEKVTTGSTVKSIEKIERNGKVTYEVEYVKEGKELEVYFTETVHRSKLRNNAPRAHSEVKPTSDLADSTGLHQHLVLS